MRNEDTVFMREPMWVGVSICGRHEISNITSELAEKHFHSTLSLSTSSRQNLPNERSPTPGWSIESTIVVQYVQRPDSNARLAKEHTPTTKSQQVTSYAVAQRYQCGHNLFRSACDRTAVNTTCNQRKSYWIKLNDSRKLANSQSRPILGVLNN